MVKSATAAVDSILATGFTEIAKLHPNKWICDEVWFHLLKHYYPELAGNPSFNRAAVVRTLNQLGGHGITSFIPPLNDGGIFCHEYRMVCPITEIRRRVKFYFVTEPGSYPQRPTQGYGGDFVRVNSQHGIVPARTTRSCPPIRGTTSTVSTHVQAVETEGSTSNNASPRKRQRGETFDYDYWESTEARKLFAPGSCGTLKGILSERLGILESVANEVEGWRKIIYGHDTGNHCSTAANWGRI